MPSGHSSSDNAASATFVVELHAWPPLERRFKGDYAFHNLLDRPRDAPTRTAFAAALFTWVFVIFRITRLSVERMTEVCRAVGLASGCR